MHIMGNVDDVDQLINSIGQRSDVGTSTRYSHVQSLQKFLARKPTQNL